MSEQQVGKAPISKEEVYRMFSEVTGIPRRRLKPDSKLTKHYRRKFEEELSQYLGPSISLEGSNGKTISLGEICDFLNIKVREIRNG